MPRRSTSSQKPTAPQPTAQQSPTTSVAPGVDSGDAKIRAALTKVVEQLEPALANFVRESLLVQGPLPENAQLLLVDLAMEAGQYRQEVQVLVALARLEERHRASDARCDGLEERLQAIQVELAAVRQASLSRAEVSVICVSILVAAGGLAGAVAGIIQLLK